MDNLCCLRDYKAGENATDNRIAHAEVTQALGNGGHTLDYLFNPDANTSELHPEGSTKRQKDIPETLPALPCKDQGETVTTGS